MKNKIKFELKVVIVYITSMETTVNNSELINSYLLILKNLETVDKLKIISGLSNSIIENEFDLRKKNLDSAFGSLELDVDVEEFIDDLRKSRYSDPNKKIDL